MKMIVQLLLPLCALLALAAGAPEVSHYSLDGANLISTSGSNFGLTENSLGGHNWKTVSINGPEVTILSEDCIARSSPVVELSSQEEQLIKDAIKRLFDSRKKTIFWPNGGISTGGRSLIVPDDNNDGNNNRVQASSVQIGNNNNVRTITIGANSAANVVSRAVAGGNSNSIANDGNQVLLGGTTQIGSLMNIQGGGFSFISHNGVSMQKTDEQNYSIAKEKGMPDNLARMFVNGDVLTYVYQDGQVQMKPIKCMQENERVLLDQLKGQVEAEKKALDEQMKRQREQLAEHLRKINENNEKFQRIHAQQMSMQQEQLDEEMRQIDENNRKFQEQHAQQMRELQDFLARQFDS